MGKAGKAGGHDRRVGDQFRSRGCIAQQFFLEPVGDRQAARIAGFGLALLRHHFGDAQIPDDTIAMAFGQGGGQIGKGPLRHRQTTGLVIRAIEMMGVGQFGQMDPGVTGLKIRFHFLYAGQVELSRFVIRAKLIQQHRQLHR